MSSLQSDNSGDKFESFELPPAALLTRLTQEKRKNRFSAFLWRKSDYFFFLTVIIAPLSFFLIVLGNIGSAILGATPIAGLRGSDFVGFISLFVVVPALVAFGVWQYIKMRKSYAPRALELVEQMLRPLLSELCPGQPICLQIKRRPGFIYFVGPWLDLQMSLKDGTVATVQIRSDFEKVSTGRKTKHKGFERYNIAFQPPRGRNFQPRAIMPAPSMITQDIQLRNVKIGPKRAQFSWKSPRIRWVKHSKRGTLIDERKLLPQGPALLQLLLSSWYLLRSSQSNPEIS